jgi:SAM-dependent methyltransferase
MPEYVAEFGTAARSEPDGRLDAVAFHRNHQPIGAVLSRYLAGTSGDVLEFGSGTGQHAVAFARLLPQIAWWPSEANEKRLASVAAWRSYAGLANLKPPVRIDLTQADWEAREPGLPSTFQGMFCANVIHISPWAVSEGLFAAAGGRLVPGGLLFLYGPFRRDGVHNAPSNAAFDARLRAENPAWGVRDIADLRALAAAAKLALVEIAEMPANNAILAFERPAT